MRSPRLLNMNATRSKWSPNLACSRRADVRPTLGQVLSVIDFYDAFAPWYHLVYQDWEASIARQREALTSFLTTEWGTGVRRLLSV
jgi:hypothetical protein